MSIEEEIDIEEVYNATNNDRNKGEALQPIPNHIKYGGLGLIALVILVIIGLSTSSSDESEIKRVNKLFDVESDVVDETKEVIENNANTVQYQDTPNTAKIPIYAEDAILNTPKSGGLDTNGIRIGKQKEESQKKLIKLEAQLNQLIADNNARQQKQDEKIEELQSQITSQLAKIDQLQANIKASKAVVKTKTRATKRYKKVFPPFTLVSIDQWGNDSYAVVRLQDQLYELTIGQLVGKWRVESIHHDKQMAVFKNHYGIRRELLVNM